MKSSIGSHVWAFSHEYAKCFVVFDQKKEMFFVEEISRTKETEGTRVCQDHRSAGRKAERLSSYHKT